MFCASKADAGTDERDLLPALAPYPKVPNTDDGRGRKFATIFSWDFSSSGPSVTWNRISWFLSVLVGSVVLSSVRDFFQADVPKSGMLTRDIFHRQEGYPTDNLLARSQL